MCGKADETINHTVNEYSKPGQKVCKKRHDQIGRHIHSEICWAKGIPVTKNDTSTRQKQSLKMKLDENEWD